MEEHNLRVFILCTHSVAGALPLGLIVCSDEKTSTLVAAFETFRDNLPPESFFGRGGITGPKIFLTDNCSEKRDTLAITWPSAQLILCIFHVLQQVWRWLHDKKHDINCFDRPFLLSRFKALVYAESCALFEDRFQELLSSQLIEENYPNFAEYLLALYDYKESWGLCFRCDLVTRGNNTNNNVEAQFLIMKELLLQRIKEYNINALFEKLTVGLNDYYNNKLLSVASGSFDGFYSKRYMGQKKKSGELGFVRPTDEEFIRMQNSVVMHGQGVFTVQSLSQPEITYLVDMNVGICECIIGKTGAPCKHQYVLWVLQKSSNRNFLPFFDKAQRQLFAEIAIGMSLPLENYEGLHDKQTRNLLSDVCVDDAVVLETLPTKNQNGVAEKTGEAGNIMQENHDDHDELVKEAEIEAIESLNEAFANIRNKIEGGENSLLTGINKFNARLQKMTTGQLISSLHLFGSQMYQSTKGSYTVSSFVKRSQKFKIGVQPEAVKHRVTKDGSKRSLKKGKASRLVSSIIPVKVPSQKRKHQFVVNVANNEPVAKKAGRSMVSKQKNRGSKQTCKVATKADIKG